MTSLTLNPTTPPMELLSTLGPGTGTPPASEDQAMAYVRGLASSHYENFSVLTRLVPRELRDDFAAVYAFCRWADDLSDETGHTEEARARSTGLLTWWREELGRCFEFALADRSDKAGRPEPPRHPVFVALARTVLRHRPPLRPFTDLIDAFQQDQRVTRYQTWDQVVDYCTRSANPVGRIVLHLAGYPDSAANSERYQMSDAICTALQLTNFWQDVRRDLLERDRVYMPEQETGVSVEVLRGWAGRSGDPGARVPFIRALRPLAERTWELFDRGRGLPSQLGWHISPVVWLFGAGGRAVLHSVERAGCATLWNRPTLGTMQKAALVGTAWVRFRLFSAAAASRPSSGGTA